MFFYHKGTLKKWGVSPSFWSSHVKAHGFSGLLQPCGSLGGKEPAGSCGETNLGGVTSWASVISDGMVVVKLKGCEDFLGKYPLVI